MIKLGDRVRDRISGLSGIAIGRTQYLHGCDHICIKPEKLQGGKPIEAQWFDEPQVELVKPSAFKPSPDPRLAFMKPGGPSLHPAPPTR